MLKKYDDKIGAREFFALMIFCIGTKYTDSTPILLISEGLNASWIIPIISGLIILLPVLCLLSLLRLYKNKNLLDIIYHLMGKFFGFIIIFLLFSISFEYLAVSTRDYADIIGTMFYLRTPMTFILFILIAGSTYIASKGFSTIASLCWLAFPVLQIVVVALVIMIWSKLDLNYLFPLGGPGVKTILKQGVYFTTIIGKVILLAIFFPKVRSHKQYKLGSFLGLLFPILNFSLFLIIYTSAFGYPTLASLNYPFHQLTRLVQIGRFARNVEALFLGFWVIASSVRLAIYLYVAAVLLGYLLRLKNTKGLVFYISIMVFLISLIPSNYTSYILTIRKIEVHTFWIYFIFVPILLWSIAKLKGEYRS